MTLPDTNFKKWRLLMDGVSSPDSFINWTWKFMISSALQRRVWFGSPDRPIFPNTYTILVGPAGAGKGICINPAMDILKHHKRKDFTTLTETSSDAEKLLIQKVDQANNEDADANEIKVKRGAEKVDPPLFPYAPDATTYEALVESMSKSGRRINYVNDKNELKVYYHCSMHFVLPELGSLLRGNRNTKDTINYLLGLYDCPLDYEYKTKTSGEDRVRRGCLNVLAGTTPEFMEDVFNEQLIDQGFSSRVFFIYASKNRKNVFVPDPLTEEQMQCKSDILTHIKELAKIYGEAKVDASTMQWLKDWWNTYHDSNKKISLRYPALAPYDARKNIHIVKVAMANHFGESTDLLIPRIRFEEAISQLEEEEPNMAQALSYMSVNPLGRLTDKVLEYIKMRKECDKVDMLMHFWKQLPQGEESLMSILSHLVATDKIKEEEKEDEFLKKVKLVYKPCK